MLPASSAGICSRPGHPRPTRHICAGRTNVVVRNKFWTVARRNMKLLEQVRAVSPVAGRDGA